MTSILNEHFVSIQGEGPNTGRLSLFVRFNGCNLLCGYCDSKYTWKKPDAYDSETASSEIVADIIIPAIKRGVNNVVFTGGEPLLHSDVLGRIVHALCFTYGTDGLTCEIETNGTLLTETIRNGSLNYLDKDMVHWNISPKLASSGDVTLSIDKATLDSVFLTGRKNVAFKFVVDINSDASIAGILEFINDYGIKAREVWLMPQSLGRQDQLDIAEKLADFAIAHSFNLSMRVHNLIWDGKRGV